MDKNIKPKVSVLMPAYNAWHYIKESIESVLGQTFRDFELLIIDDCSTDSTPEIIKSFNDKRIRYVRNDKNMGLIDIRNKAVALARGTYLAWLDADDVSLPKRLEKQVRFLEGHGEFGLVGSAVQVIDENGKPTGVVWDSNIAPEKMPIYLIFGNCFTQSSVMIRKSALPDTPYRQGFPFAGEDYDLWIRISQKWLVGNLPEILTKYRAHQGGIIRSKKGEKEKAANKIARRELERFGVNPSDEELRLHRTNFGFDGNNIKEFLKKREVWLRFLSEKNNVIGIYKKEIFEEVIAEKWLASCSANAKIGWQAWEIFWQSHLSTHLAKRQNLKELLKFLLKIV